MKLIKVIHIISSLGRGGKERQLATIYKYHNRDLQEIKILYLHDRSINYIEEFSINASDLLKIHSKKFILRLLECHRILKTEKPDVVYAWGTIEVMIPMLLKPFHRYILINGSIRHGIISKKLSHYWRYLLLHISKNIIANSKAGLKVNHINNGYILYNGIDEKFFNSKVNSKEIEDLKNRLIRPVLISVANLVPYKDYFTVIEALSDLKKEGLNFSYIIIGSGPLRNEIVESISKNDLNEQILMLGSKDNIEEYLAISDLFIHSSKGEGCSNAILEAMAAGLPIIATNVGGTPEIVNDSNGILFQYKNSIELKIAIKNLISNEKLFKSLGFNSKRIAQQICSKSSMIHNYHELIENIYRQK